VRLEVERRERAEVVDVDEHRSHAHDVAGSAAIAVGLVDRDVDARTPLIEGGERVPEAL
jgi:hypothetical protein